MAFYYFYRDQGLQAFYLPLPAWIGCGLLYIVFSKIMNRPTAQARA
jgi:hypothetical protein